MDASKPIHLQVNDIRETWQETWYAMAKGSKSEYDQIKATPVFEFWKIFDLWKDQIRRERDAAKARKGKK